MAKLITHTLTFIYSPYFAYKTFFKFSIVEKIILHYTKLYDQDYACINIYWVPYN